MKPLFSQNLYSLISWRWVFQKPVAIPLILAVFLLLSPKSNAINIFPETGEGPSQPFCQSSAASFFAAPIVQIDVTGSNFACDGQSIALRATVVQNMTGSATFAWSIISLTPGLSGSFSAPTGQNTNFSGFLSPATVPPGGSGTAQLEVTMIDGMNQFDKDTVELKFFRATRSLACNDKVHISLDGNCEAYVLPDDVLEGTYPDYDLFDVVIFDRGRNIGNKVTDAQIGRTMTVRVIDRCNANYCWGELTVEDKMAPRIDCNVAVQTHVIQGEIDNGDGRYHRTVDFVPGQNPATCILSNLSMNPDWYYDAFRFTIPVTGSYTFQMVSHNIPVPVPPGLPGDIDAFGAIYKGDFNPSLPCENILIADDDQYTPNLGPSLTLNLTMAPGDYTLVSTSHWPLMTGSFVWNISGPALASGDPAGVLPLSNDTIFIDCNDDPAKVPKPMAFDNCDIPITPYLIGETFIEFGCNRADGCVRIIEKTWRAKDKYNNYSPICKQIIKVIRRTLADVDFPPNYDDIEKPALDCAQPMSDAHPDSLDMGWPTIDGDPLTNINFCKLNVGYRDLILQVCGRSKKILREWTILDWCNPLQPGINPRTHTQLIKFIDKKPPVVTCPQTVIVASTDPDDCTATVLFPPIAAVDDCSGIIVQINTPNGVVHGNGGFLSGFDLGDYPVSYIVSDSCGNTTTCRRILRILDQIEPVAVCIQFLTTSLTVAGVSEVFATSFDAGSYDNCCLEKFEVKRMTDPDSKFGPSVKFNCDDVGDTVMVVIRVWDCFGNYNTCMVNVDVRDKLPPNLICPPDAMISCKDNKDDLSKTGRPTAIDGCPIIRVTYTDDDRRNRCGVGKIYRTFIAEDVSRNTKTCTQVIMVVNDHPFDSTTIRWPRDTGFMNDCGRGLEPDSLPPGYDYPVFPRTPFCADLMMRYEDEVFTTVPDACYKIIRTWTIIDWCTYDSNNPRAGGRWQHRQNIKVIDVQPPVLDCPDSLEFFVSAHHTCEAMVTIDTPDVTDCSDKITFTITGAIPGPLGSTHKLTVGRYPVQIFASDGCRNTGVCSFTVIVRDTTPPTPVCQSIAVPVGTMNDGEVWVCAAMFDPGKSSYDNCSDSLIYSFSRDTSDQCRLYDCDSVGFHIVQIWVTDEYGNQDFCTDTLEIQDNNGLCSGHKPALAGAIKRSNGDPISSVTVSMSGRRGRLATTGADGQFTFTDLETGEDYTVYPRRDDHARNGVSTYDLSLISKHILRVTPFTSPYHIIAADANNSETVTTLDLTLLRKLVLHLIDELPNNTSWRFVRADYVFPNPENPWQVRFPEVFSINNISRSNLNADFVAIKVGDVNSNANPGSFNEVEERSFGEPFVFETELKSWKKNEEVVIPFRATDFEKMVGYQFTFHFNNDLLQFADIVPGAIAGLENFGLRFLEKGMITTSWHSGTEQSFDKNAVLFSLKFNTLADGNAENALWIDGTMTVAEAYNSTGEIFKPVLKIAGAEGIVEAKAQFQLFQNEPNPFSKETVIRFTLPETTEATLTILDFSGRVLKTIEQQFSQGLNEVKLTRDELQQKGVLFYRLQTGNKEAVKKMILID